MISKCERQSCDSAIQRFNGLLVDEKWNDANEGDTFLAHPRFFVGIACDNDFTEGVMYVGQRKKLLFALGFVRDLPRGLDVDALRIAIYDKVDFVLPLFAHAVLGYGTSFDDTDVNRVAAANQFVVNDIFHQMRRLVLPKVHLDIAQPRILGIVFDGIIKVVLPLDVISRGPSNEKCVTEIIKIFRHRDGVRGQFGNSGDGICQFSRIRETSDITHHDVEEGVQKRFIPNLVALSDIAQVDGLAEVVQIVAFGSFIGFQDAVGEASVHQIFSENGLEIGDRLTKRQEFGHRERKDADLLATSAESRRHVARQHFRVRSRHIAVNARRRTQFVQNVVKSRVARVKIVGMNARKVDVGIQCPLAILNLVNENIVGLSVVNEALLNVCEKRVGGAKILRRFLFKVNFDDVFGRDASSKQMLLEQLEQQITLSATTNTSNNLNETIVFCGNKLVKVQVSVDCHSEPSNLISVEKASNFKAKRVYHNRCSGTMVNFFHFPRHILCSKPEYIMESMEKKDTKSNRAVSGLIDVDLSY